MGIEKLKALPKEEAFAELVTALDNVPLNGQSRVAIIKAWAALERHHNVHVSAATAWGYFDKVHGTDIAKGMQLMEAM